MSVSLRPLHEQVMVITGASSGIGLATARMAAAAGARVVLAARNEQDLDDAVARIAAAGGTAIYVVADVAKPAQVETIADQTIERFGRINTWVNNAAASMYGRIMELSHEDVRRQFDVNFWGTVYGSRTAVPHLWKQGGALINVASVLADRAVPLQGIYCAAKHAMKAFTDTLRMELEAEGAPISVSLVKPGSTNTPFFQKARTYLWKEPRPVPPVHAPDVPAQVILECATRPVRDVIVGGAGRLGSLLGTIAPRLSDYYMEQTLFEGQETSEPVGPDRRDNLHEPVEHDGGERGRYQGRVMERSVYTRAALHPVQTALIVGALGIVVASAASLTRR